MSGTSIQIDDNKMPASGTYIAGDDKKPKDSAVAKRYEEDQVSGIYIQINN